VLCVSTEKNGPGRPMCLQANATALILQDQQIKNPQSLFRYQRVYIRKVLIPNAPVAEELGKLDQPTVRCAGGGSHSPQPAPGKTELSRKHDKKKKGKIK
jgi:hypothetical protein